MVNLLNIGWGINWENLKGGGYIADIENKRGNNVFFGKLLDVEQYCRYLLWYNIIVIISLIPPNT